MEQRIKNGQSPKTLKILNPNPTITLKPMGAMLANAPGQFIINPKIPRHS